MGPAFRFEPLLPPQFAVGEGPFRARGLAYVSALKYIQLRLPGGMPAFVAALGADHPFLPFYDQIFLVSGEYDVSPLLQIFLVCARIEGVDPGRFIIDRSRWSAEADTKGVWKPLLEASTPEGAAERTKHAFVRYFSPCSAQVLGVQPGRFEGELLRIPACMSGVYTSATTGFVEAALALAGAPGAKTQWQRPVPDGMVSGVAVEKIRFLVTWRV